MDAHGVQVFHVAHRDAVVVLVSHHLVLQLLPTLQGLVDDHLGAVDQSHRHQLPKLVLVVGEAAAQPAKGECGPHQHRVANLLCGMDCFRHRPAAAALGDPLAAGVHHLAEEVAVLRLDDGLDGGAQHLHVEAIKDPLLVEPARAVQGRLAAEGHEDAVRALPVDDLGHELRGHRQEVNAVRHARRGLNGGDVRVDQHGHDAGLLQGLQRLAARVIELSCLADRQTAGAQHQHLAIAQRQGVRDGRHGRGGGLCDELQELLEKEVRVHGPAAGLGVELDGEPGP
mmetsp:Transcript_132073/g.313032  ORF Transcript_132073/g.313032 Transcript_132073/m.313032 type:complete len:284 (-) Transcript_132073:1157-2008(-)